MHLKTTIVEYDERYGSAWDEFLSQSNNGTLFHNLNFLGYHPQGRFHERHLIFLRGGKTVGVMPMASFKDGSARAARSPYGGSFGGVATPIRFSYTHCEDLVMAMKTFLEDSDFAEMSITPPPKIYGRVQSNYFEFNLLAGGFWLAKREVTSVINLSSFDNNPFEIMEKRSRTAVKKAKKEGVQVVEFSEDYESFYGILTESKERHNALPTHTLDELMKIRSLVPGSAKLDMAYINGDPAAGILYFLCNPQVILAFYICHKSQYKNYSPVSLLLYQGILWSKKNNFRFLDLGTTTLNGAPNYGLFMFKESFGSTGYFRDTFNWMADAPSNYQERHKRKPQ